MPVGRPVRLAPAAKSDLRDIWRYNAKRATPDVADKLLREIDGAISRLDRQGVPGRSRDDLLPGLRAVLSHPHIVFFRLAEDHIEIVRVLHEHRDFPALFRINKE